MTGSLAGNRRCGCTRAHDTRLVVVTGGPGAGKTAALEVARRHFCQHVVVLPESATIVYSGGFPRLDAPSARRRSQIAIEHVQDQMERLEMEQRRAALVLCDRGLLDGLAYWPGDEASFLGELGTTKAELLARYTAIVHLRPPDVAHGYGNGDERHVRIESAPEAAEIDARIERAYEGHPDRHFVASTDGFMDKISAVMAILHHYVPSCCEP